MHRRRRNLGTDSAVPFRQRLASAYPLLLLLSCIALWPSAARGAFTDESASRLPQEIGDSYAIAAGDVDDNGTKDLVVATAGQTFLFLNDGNGVFTDATGQLPVIDATVLGLALEDVDGDLDPDIVLANASGPNLLLVNDGLGAFSDESGLRLPGHDEVSTDVAVVDVNQDDAPDIVVANRGSANRLLLNDGTGGFADAPDGNLPADGDLTQAIAVADVNDDGASDLFFANDGGQNRLYTGNGLGLFTDATGTALPGLMDESLDAAFGDVDDDGDADLLLANGGSGVNLLLNAAGTFTHAAPGALPALPDYAIAVALGDLDFDGSPDVVVGNAGQDRVLLNDGLGQFQDGTSELPADDGRSFGLSLANVDADFDLDLTVAVPQGTDRLLISRTESPLIRMAVSPEFIVVGDTVTIAVEAFDDDGVVATTLEVNGIPVALDAGGIGTFVPTADGTHTAVVTALDTLGNVGTRSVTFVVAPPDLTNPTVTLTISASTPILVGQPVTIQATATDSESGVASLVLTVNGQPIPLDASGAAIFVPTTDDLYTVVAEATDFAGNVGSETDSFDVLPDVDAPVVSLSAAPDPVDLATPISIDVSATDNVSVVSLTLGVSGPGISGEQALTIDAGGQSSFTPYVAGTYTLIARASDAGGNIGTATFDFEAIGVADMVPPVVSVTVVPPVVLPGDPVTVTVTATDNVLVTSVSLEINGTPVPLDVTGSAVFTPPVIGDYTALGRALDPTGNEGTAQQIFSAVDPATDTDPPVVAITSPVDGAEISAPTEIFGTASDLTLTQYTLAYAVAGSGNYVTFASGTQSVQNGVLGSLDPAQLQEEIYRIRLRAVDVNGLVSTAERDYVVETRTTPGVIQMAFADVETRVAGIPVTLIRSYDSRVKTSEDFGVGWSLTVKQGSYRNNRPPGEGWQILPGGGFLNPPCSISDETAYHLTRIRLSSQESYEFRLQVNMFGFGSTITGACLGTVEFVQISGPPGAQLDIFGTNAVVWLQGTDYLTYDLGDPDFGSVWEPTDVRLTTADSRVFDMNLTVGLTRAEDANANEIFITPSGITNSAGVGLSFSRDGQGRITQVVDSDSRGRTYAYNSNGDLVQTTDFLGFATTYRYDLDHNLLELEDPRGEVPGRLVYDGDGRVVGVVDAEGNVSELALSLDGQTEVLTDRLGNTLVRTYDDFGNLDTSRDPLGNTTTFTYDSRGNLLTRTDPLGNVETLTYEEFGNVLSYTDADGNTTTSTFNAQGKILSTTDPLGRTESYEYDPSGNRTAIVTPRGGRIEMTYDSAGQLTSLTDAEGNTATYGFDATGLLTGFTDPLGRAATMAMRNDGKIDFVEFAADGTTHRYDYSYDTNGNVTSLSLPTGASSTAEYDESGRLTSATNTNGDTQTLTFDSLGDPAQLVGLNGGTATVQRDIEGRVVGATSPAGFVMERELDGLGRPVRVSLPSGGEATFEYDAAGRIIRQQRPGRGATTNTFDATGRVLATTAPDGGVTNYEYDAAGQLTAIVNPLGERTEFTYDLDGNVIETLLPDGSAVASEYDLTGQLSLIRDERGAELNYTYNAVGQLTQAVDPAGGITTYSYDEMGNVTQASLPGGSSWSFASNPLGVKTSTTYPWGGTEQFTLDPRGMITAIDDAEGDTTNFTRNASGQVLSTTFASGDVESRTYDLDNQLTGATDSEGTTTIAYAAQGRVSRVDRPDGSFVEYVYDLENRVGSITTPSGETAYVYDASGRLVQVDDDLLGTADYTYDVAGRLVTAALPDGTTTIYTRNVRGWPTNIQTLASDGVTLIRNDVIAYDEAGNPTSIVELDRTVAYTFDGAGRLASEVRTGADAAAVSYGYDADWNLTQFGARTLAYNAGLQLTTDGIWSSYSHDANGRVSSRTDGTTTESFEYDSIGRLARMSRSGGSVSLVELEYNEMNLVRRIVVDGVGRRLLWDTTQAAPLLLEETTDAGILIRRYVQGLGPIGVVAAGQSRIIHQDRHGSVRLITATDGSVVEKYAFGAYGDQTVGLAGYDVPLRYAGEYFVSELGMYFLRSRFYDPTAGRFLTPDLFAPLERFPSTYNPYLYAGANPTRFSDPLGNFSMGSISVGMAITNILVSIALPHFPSPILMIAKAAGLTQADQIIGASFVLAYGKGNFTGGLQLDVLKGGDQWVAVVGVYFGLQVGISGSSGRNATSSPGFTFWLGSIYGVSNERPVPRPGAYFFLSGTIANAVVKYAVKPRNEKVDPAFGRGAAAIQFEIASKSAGGGVEFGLGFKKAFTIYGSNWGKGALGRQIKRKNLWKEGKYAFASGISLTIYIPVFSVTYDSVQGIAFNDPGSFW